jgi:hypothetical protein
MFYNATVPLQLVRLNISSMLFEVFKHGLPPNSSPIVQQPGDRGFLLNVNQGNEQ